MKTFKQFNEEIKGMQIESASIIQKATKFLKRGFINKYLDGKIDDEAFTASLYNPDEVNLTDAQKKEFKQAIRNIQRLKKFKNKL